jgi:hypothetical protein
MSGEDRRWGSDVDGLAEPTVTVEIAEDDSSASLLLGSISREKTQGPIAEQIPGFWNRSISIHSATAFC